MNRTERAACERTTDIVGSSVDADGCDHLPVALSVAPTSRRCEPCASDRVEWASLRVCLTCGEVGCCDSSVGRHASAHHETTGHPVMASAEPGERWQWCFVHAATFNP